MHSVSGRGGGSCVDTCVLRRQRVYEESVQGGGIATELDICSNNYTGIAKNLTGVFPKI